MIHFLFPNPTTNNQKPYFNEAWVRRRGSTSLTKCCSQFWTPSSMRSSMKKKRLNPFDEAPPASFKIELKRWIESTTLKGIVVKFIFLDTITCMTGSMTCGASWCYWHNWVGFIFARQCCHHFCCSFNHAHNERGSYSVERPRLGVLSKHFARCKGNSKGCRLPL